MKFVWYVLAGALSGVLGGMGMGGGTLLIPLLSIFYSVNQHVCQAVNLISFIPMAIVALIIHIKNKLVVFKCLAYVIVPAILFGIMGSFLAKDISGELLGRMFGGFLIILSVFQFLAGLKKTK